MNLMQDYLGLVPLLVYKDVSRGILEYKSLMEIRGGYRISERVGWGGPANC